MLGNIPTDLLSNILLRLPFQSLIQYRCVSKSWRDSIDSNYFQETHFQKSLLVQTHPHPDSKIITFNDGKFYAFDSVRKIKRSLYNVSTAKELQFPLPNSKFSKRNIILTGSSNGVLCLSSSRTDDLVLWNPWTGKWSMLPPCPNEFTKYYRWSKGYDAAVGVAFGHGKVVKWHVSLNHSTMSTSDRYEVCVYSLKTNSWKRIRDDSLTPLMPFHHHLPSFLPRETAVVNGAIHWLVRGNFIVAFDLETEGFRRISCEPCFNTSSSNYRRSEELCSLNGRLCYLYSYDTTVLSEHYFYCFGWDVWEMEDYGVEGSWRKVMISMEAAPNMGYCSRIRPVAFSGKMRRLFFQSDIMSSRMGVYDMEKKVFGEVLINGEAVKYGGSCLLCVGSFANPCHSAHV